jgi:uncharacterized membrane protein YfcA
LGAYATLIGVGGGFVLVPMLLLLHPGEDPATVAAISLAVVFVNALSGTLAYWRQRRIDFRAGRLFALCVVPGSILGAMATSLFPRGIFDVLVGLMLLGGAVFLFLSPGGERGSSRTTAPAPESASATPTRPTPRYDPKLGGALSFVAGIFASSMGIGGGVIMVPFMAGAMQFPPHTATATSQLIVAVTAMAATAVHIVQGSFAGSDALPQAVPLAFGVAIGAQIGAWQSRRVRGPTLIRFLSLGLGFVGIRLLFG